MAILSVDFEWTRPKQGRANKGFELGFREVRPPMGSPRSIGAFLKSKPIPVVRWKDGISWERYRPLERYPDLVGEFSRVVTDQSALTFYSRYGALWNAEATEPGDDVETILKFAGEVRSNLYNFGTGPARMVQNIGLSGEIALPVQCILAADLKTKDLKVLFRTDTLAKAIVLQSFLNMSGPRVFRTCRECNKRFEAGPHSKPRRRLDSKFCSPECQIAHKRIHTLKEDAQ